jgi:hypothetical protein
MMYYVDCPIYIFFLFNDIFNISDYIITPAYEYWIGMDVDGNGRGLI